MTEYLPLKNKGEVIGKAHPDFLTCRVRCLEAFSLNWCIRNEAEKHFVSSSNKRIWYLIATQASQNWWFFTFTIKHFQVVISTFLMLFDLKLIEGLGRGKKKKSKMTQCSKVFTVLIWYICTVSMFQNTKQM